MMTLPRPAGEADIIEQIALRAFGLDRRISTLQTANRGKADVALARQVVMYTAHTYLGMTLTAAGALFGRDRTTAAHACRVVEDRRDDQTFDEKLAIIERELTRWRVAVGRSVRQHDDLRD